MATFSPVRGRTTRRTGRRRESDVLDELVDAVRSGKSGALVVRGEPGVGKTALLEYVAEQAAGCLVVRATTSHSRSSRHERRRQSISREPLAEAQTPIRLAPISGRGCAT